MDLIWKDTVTIWIKGKVWWYKKKKTNNLYTTINDVSMGIRWEIKHLLLTSFTEEIFIIVIIIFFSMFAVFNFKSQKFCRTQLITHKFLFFKSKTADYIKYQGLYQHCLVDKKSLFESDKRSVILMKPSIKVWNGQKSHLFYSIVKKLQNFWTLSLAFPTLSFNWYTSWIHLHNLVHKTWPKK